MAFDQRLHATRRQTAAKAVEEQRGVQVAARGGDRQKRPARRQVRFKGDHRRFAEEHHAFLRPLAVDDRRAVSQVHLAHVQAG